MEVSVTQHGAVAVLDLRGPLSGEHLADMDRSVQECIRNGALKIVLDLAQTPLIDSEGLEKIHALVTDLGKQGGDIRVAGANDLCKDIFRATRLDNIVQVFEDRHGAVSSLS